MEISEAELTAKINKAVTDATAPLITKREELMDEVKNLKKAKKEQDDAIEAERQAKLTAEGKHAEVLESVRTAHKTQLDGLQTKYDNLNLEKADTVKKLHGEIAKNKLSAAFTKAGVTVPEYLEAALALNLSKAVVTEATPGVYTVTVDNMDIDAYVTSWKDGAGKAFISSGISGGGAGNEDTGSSEEYEQYFVPATVNYTKQKELQAKDPKRYGELKKKYTNAEQLPLSAVPVFPR